MAQSGIPRIDSLLAGSPGAASLGSGDADSVAVGLAQDLLRCHGFSRLPDPRAASYGRFGDLTRSAVLAYRAAAGLDANPAIDRPLLGSMIAKAAPDPVAARGYLTLVLDCNYDDVLGIVALVALFESAGRFACLNRNTDRAGLSFGIVQWAQSPGRLHELLDAFQRTAPGELLAAVGSAGDVAGLLAHTAKPGGGVDAVGASTDPAFDLVAEPWKSRFEAMGRSRALQRVQANCAVAAFKTSLARVRQQAPRITTQRAYAFMLDLSNQHGDGGAVQVYNAVVAKLTADATGPNLIESMAVESVRRVAAKYGAGSPEVESTRSRREFFRTTSLLADAPFKLT